MDLVTVKNKYPEIWKLTDILLQNWQEHSQFITKSFESHSQSNFELLNNLAGDILRVSDGYLGELVEGYRWMCDSFTEEELYFRRNGEYRCKTIEQAIKETYSNPQIMKWYMNGLLLSQLLWSNHSHAYISFLQNYLPRLPKNFKYLEIGCGHGLYISQAACNSNANLLCGWDISEQSIQQTRMALSTFGIEDKVELSQRDIYAANDSNNFDALVLSEILEHLEDPVGALKNLSNQMQNGGLVFINVPINSPAPDHIFLLRSIEEAINLVKESGYEILDHIAFPMTGYSIERAIATEATITCVIIAKYTH